MKSKSSSGSLYLWFQQPSNISAEPGITQNFHKGDEWKMAFSTSMGHYKYLIMPFGLVNSPSMFQAFINDIFPDMLSG